MTTLVWQDYLAIVIFVIFVLGVGLFSSRRSKADLSGYFLASRSMHWLPVGASMFASNVGSSLFLGVAGSGAAGGVGVAAYELSAIYVLIFLGWFFVPVYLSSGVFTMPEYLRQRFGGQRIRVYLAVLSLLLYIFTKISGDLFAGALFIQEVVGESSPTVLYSSALGILAMSGLFTIVGGLTAVMWTDFVQTILILIGAVVIMILSYIRIGGFGAIVDQFPYAMPSKLVYNSENRTCGLPTPYAFHLLRPASDSDYPWTGTIFGIAILGTWHWCTDQVIVQRTLTSRNIIHAKAGCVFTSWLKILPIWLLVFPGMAARILFPDEVACVDPEECKKICGSPAGCSNLAFIKLVMNLLPIGFRGCILAVILAAIMSSLTSVFNSASTIFTIDIWATLRRGAWKNKPSRQVEIEQVIVGRMSVFVVVVVSVLWIPIIQNFSNSQLYVYAQSITSFLVPPITAVFLLAVFWSRANEPGAFWGLMLGLVVGMTRFIMEFGYVIPPCGSGLPDPRPDFIKIIVGNFNFLNFSILLFFLTLLTNIAVSYITAPIPASCLHRLTYQTRNSLELRVPIQNLRDGAEESSDITNNQTPDYDNQGETSAMTSAFVRLCCMHKESNAQAKTVAVETHEEHMTRVKTFMTEDPKEKRLVDISAAAVVLTCTFVYGFYG
ncbi:sodium/glucose cotransporter 5 [Hyalella azteca]|uniref:Sodium/glucose cotransporter 5 n=1 Tax=Hyalella azteca TaxID=294128 RepID=A0A8B7PGP0_HYAAZ|nr:sodium/glucose cotransporter 5 [Hyalella azteca]